MYKKNTAVIVTLDAEFQARSENLLSEARFKVRHCSPDKDWELSCLSEDMDCIFIDNRDNEFKYAPLINHLKSIQAQLFIINIGPVKPRIQKNPYLVFAFDSQTNEMHLTDFLISAGKLVKDNRAKLDLASMLLHDTRSPLNSLIGYLELLLNNTFGQIGNGQRKILEKTMELGDNTLEMLEDLSEVIKSSQQSILLQKQNFDVYQLLESILINIWVKADSKDIKITKRISPDVGQVFGDDYQIQRVITNLLNNAIKYCPNHSHINIQISLMDSEFALITVSDNGGGVPAEQLNKLFKKYFRVEEKEKIQKGYGLGLYICRVIIKSHGGKIWAENNNNNGLSIHFTLPLAE